jgi:DNA repair protein RadC
MKRIPGCEGRPLDGVGEEELFRAAFPEDWEGMRRAAGGTEPLDPLRRARWEAAVELARRALSVPEDPSLPIRGAADVYARYRFLLAGSPVEVFLAVLLDVKNRVLRDVRVSTGILDGSLLHPREVFAPAVRERAASVILVHNHPSGDPSPSGEDREATRRLRAAGKIVGIAVLDHVIISGCSFYSFAEDGSW